MKTFYDAHFHVQNLTHPHLEAFIDRLQKDSAIAKLLLKPVNPALIDALLLAAPLAGLYRIITRALKGIGGHQDSPTEAHLRILNLLVLMNRPIDEFLQAVHNEVDELVIRDSNFSLKQDHFEKVVLCALIMDFTDRDYTSSWTKTIPYANASKPVVRQTEDLLAGIKRYRENVASKNETARLTVLPFLGLNPENYGLEPDNYVLLKAKLDTGLVEDFFNVSLPTHCAFYTHSAPGRLTWLKSTISDAEIARLKAAIKPNQTAEDVQLTLAALDDLKLKIDNTLISSVALLVDLNTNPLSTFASKFVYEPKGQGGLFTWKTSHMSDDERNALVGALKRPTDNVNIRDRNAYTYSIGRIEFLFSSLENKGTTTIQKLLSQFFGSHQVTKADVEANQSMWTGNIEDMKPGLFTGIKLYPPLGFDPNPGGLSGSIHRNTRKKRVWYLYKFCEQRQIPITVHTSDGGFQIMRDELHYKFTSPERWKGVLQNFPKLRVNFAHCGVQSAIMDNGEDEWKTILFKEIMCAKNADGTWAYPNVYADVSDLLNTSEAYAQWERGMARINLSDSDWQHVSDRLLFGSDFMINLRESESYSDYISRFVKNKPNSFPAKDNRKKLQFLNEDLRYKMCVVNPERFLFPNG